MRILNELGAPRSAKSPISGLVTGLRAMVVAGIVLGSAGPALSGRDAPAVWVPLAPAGGALGAARIGRPIVLVPFQRTVTLPGPALESNPWVPDYLAPYLHAPSGAPSPPAARSGGATAGAGPAGGRTGLSAVNFSDVVRAVDWRRATARRLRAEPDFTPRF